MTDKAVAVTESRKHSPGNTDDWWFFWSMCVERTKYLPPQKGQSKIISNEEQAFTVYSSW